MARVGIFCFLPLGEVLIFTIPIIPNSAVFGASAEISAIISATILSQTASCIWFCFNFGAANSDSLAIRL